MPAPGSAPAPLAGEIFKQTAAGLGFPNDRLSVSILAFARFFSLPLNQALLASLRREFLSSNTASQGTVSYSGDEKAALEAKVLALVSAMDKGVALGPEALLRYARFLAPGIFKDKDALFPKGSAPPKKNTVSGGNAAIQGGGKGKKAASGEIPKAEEIRAIADEQSGEGDLLDFLNRLPGKNGQYWMVFPFKIELKGVEFSVFLRILNRGQGAASGRFSRGENEFLIADIVSPKKQWRFFLNKAAGKLRADIRVYPEYSPGALKVLAREAERFLGFEEILVRNGEEAPSWVEDMCAEHLPSIDEEV